MMVLHEYVMANLPEVKDFVSEVPNGVFMPRKHRYNANNKRKKGKKK